jgi:GT2 family glycosyltransferase
MKTNYDYFEVIFVDNGSTDNSVEYVINNFKDSRISIVQTRKNFGVPGGRNIGFEKSMGEYVVFLDNDTEVDKEWLVELLKVFESDSKIAVAQCKLLNMVLRNKFDHAGDYLTPAGFLFERSNQGIDRGQFDKVEDIFNAKGAATMVKRSIFRELGMYDESYFMYLEETDFCFRVWLAGYRVVFAPKAIVWHAFNTPLKEAKKYYSNSIIKFNGCRNYITTLLKNLELKSLIGILPLHILCWIALSFMFLIKLKFSDSFLIIKAIFWNLLNFTEIIKKRSLIQENIRKIRDNDFMDRVMIKKSLNFYFKKATCYIRGVAFE